MLRVKPSDVRILDNDIHIATTDVQTFAFNHLGRVLAGAALVAADIKWSQRGSSIVRSEDLSSHRAQIRNGQLTCSFDIPMVVPSLVVKPMSDR